MLNTKALANAGAIVSILSYFVCFLALLLFPDLVFSLLDYAVHGIDVETLRLPTIKANISEVIIGALIISIYTWLNLYAFGYVYNKLRK